MWSGPRRLLPAQSSPPLLLAPLLLCAPALSACLEPNPGFVGQDGGAQPPPTRRDARAPADTLGPDSSPGCTASCDSPPGPCWAAPGLCDPQSGQCAYERLPEGTSCPLTGGCAPMGICDAQGRCVAGACQVPHATGGHCIDEACVGFSCLEGRGDCNGAWNDGCEAQLATDPENCGACGQPCGFDPPNATTRCVKGECVLTCKPPYKDCNEDPADGCEIPVGEPNSCSRQGLTTFETSPGATPGCGTPYCGKGTFNDESFGSWYCSFCDHCAFFDDGAAWCLQHLGTFSGARCKTCCDPQLFPQVCAP